MLTKKDFFKDLFVVMSDTSESRGQGADARTASEPGAAELEERKRARERNWRRRNPELSPLMRNSAARAASRAELPSASEPAACSDADHSLPTPASGSDASASPGHSK